MSFLSRFSDSFEFLVGLRYLRARRRRTGGGFVSFISFASMGGIAVGVLALIVVMSVMNGFQEELRASIVGVTSHVEILSTEGGLKDWPSHAAIAAKDPQVKASAPYVDGQGMLAFEGTSTGVMVRGIEPALEDKVADFTRFMKVGALSDLKPGEFDVVLGINLAQQLHVAIGDKVTLIVPQGIVTPAAVLPRIKQFRVTGVFEAGLYEYDSRLALVNIADAQKLYQMGDSVSGMRLKLDDLFSAPVVAQRLNTQMPMDAFARDWTQGHANFFRAVQTEKTVMFVILFLVVMVAAFNIVSGLVMAVQDKQADIAILRTLGASPGSIMGIFVVQGGLMGMIGVVIGTVGGILLALNLDVVVPWMERNLHIVIFPKDVYQLSSLPSKLLWSDVTITIVVSIAISLLATIYPSWRASRINPAEALRYE